MTENLSDRNLSDLEDGIEAHGMIAVSKDLWEKTESEPALSPEFDPKELQMFTDVCTRTEAALLVARDFGKTGGINDQDSADRAAEVLALVKGVYDDIETSRKASYRPLEDRKSAINNTFKEIRGPVEAVVEALKKSIGQFNREKREEAAELQAKLDADAAEAQAAEEEEAAKEGREAREIQAPEVVATPTTRTTATGRVSGGQVRKYRVLDFSKMPDEFKEENNGALHRAAVGGRDNVPGVEFYYDETISVNKK